MIQLIAEFKAFHSAYSKTIIGVQEANSPYSIDEISLSTTLWTQKCVYNQLKAINSRMVVSRQFDYSKSSKKALQCRRRSQFIANLGVSVRSGVSSSINSSDETRGCESLQLSHGHWIGDGPSRFRHVARFRHNA